MQSNVASIINLERVQKSIEMIAKSSKQSAIGNIQLIINDITVHSQESFDLIKQYRKFKYYDESLKDMVRHEKIAATRIGDIHKLDCIDHRYSICISQRELSVLTKQSIPISYVVFLCISISLLLVSLMLLIFGMFFGLWLISLWVCSMFVIGSAGMVITVLAGIYEWRKKIRERFSKR